MTRRIGDLMRQDPDLRALLGRRRAREDHPSAEQLRAALRLWAQHPDLDVSGIAELLCVPEATARARVLRALAAGYRATATEQPQEVQR